MSSPILRVLLLPGLVCLLTGVAVAQGMSQMGATLQVRVVQANDRPVDEQTRVELQTSTGLGSTSAFTDSTGMAFFPSVRSGAYRLRVTGLNIAETVTNSFFVDARERNHSETVVVQPRTPPQASDSGGGQTVAVVDLNVPKSARKDFDKGVEAFNDNQLDNARKHLEKAISQYPNFASAYNLLGLTFMRQGQPGDGQQAFEKAIQINDRFADAYINLAKGYFGQKKFDRCEALLEKSLAVEPRSPEALTILAQVELMAGKYDQAVVNARRVHDLPHKNYAIAHFVAARALRARNQRDDAMVEYKLFLKEAPDSSSSPMARQELAQLERQKP